MLSDYTPKPKKKLPAKSPFSRILALKCFKDVKDRVLAGWSLEQLTRFIQIDKKELTELKSSTLNNLLRRYRMSLPPGDFVALGDVKNNMVTQRMQPLHEEAMKLVDEGLDEIQELQRLYNVQLERIAIDISVERSQKKLIPSMTQEVRVAREILDTSLRLKMDLGLKKRHLGLMETEARIMKDVGEKYGDVKVVEALNNSQSRQRLAGVMAAFERFMLTDGKAEKVGSSILDELADVFPDEEIAPAKKPVTAPPDFDLEEIEDTDDDLPETETDEPEELQDEELEETFP